MIRVLIVDDRKVVRESIEAFLSSVADLEIVGTASDGYDAMSSTSFAIAQAKELQPDIILMDIEMPGLNGL